MIVSLAACGGSDGDSDGQDKPGQNDPGQDNPGQDDPFAEDAVGIYPSVVHAGFDGTNTFKAPVVLFSGSDQVEWTLSDDTIASVEVLPVGKGIWGTPTAILTTKKAGTAEITAKAGDQTVTAKLIVTEYTPAQTALGKTRYENPANPGVTRTACAGCHALATGADHSPTMLAVAPDAPIVTAIETGEYPAFEVDGEKYETYKLRGVAHKYNLTDEEKVGIIAYLRSLEPKIETGEDSQ
ncbi:MAG: hypothetical protein MJE77_20610 [Proteobacteria bacterium]|nr:hypothetical protein [Pseudomonadota bacterium]